MTGPPSRGAVQFRLPNVEQSYPALPYAKRKKHDDQISWGLHVVFEEFHFIIHSNIPKLFQQLGYVAPVVPLRSVQFGGEERCAPEELCAVVAETVGGLLRELANVGGVVPVAAIRGAIHRRRRVLRTLILEPVVQKERREKGRVRHRKAFASRQPSPKAYWAKRSVKNGAGEPNRAMLGNEAKRTLFLRGKMR